MMITDVHSFADYNYQSKREDRIKIVIIGAGLIGPRHAKHVKKRADTELFGIVDHSSKGPIVADEFETVLYKNVDEMLESCAQDGIYPDAAIVATPNHTHLEIGRKLALNGIHLLIEKPLAPSAEECKLLIDICAEQQIILLVGHHRRFNPYIVAAKENLERLGKVIAVQGSWTLRKPDSYFLEKPWRSSVELGGGALLINLIHDLDLLQYLMGPVERVYAELLHKQRATMNSEFEGAVDEGAVLTLRFANGSCGTFICSDNVTSPFSFEVGTGENPTIPFNDAVSGFYRIFGSEGTLSIPDLTLYHQKSHPENSWLYPVASEKIKMKHEIIEDSGMPSPSASPEYHDSPIHDYSLQEKPLPFDLQLEHFIDLLQGYDKFIKCSGEDALSALLCIEAVTRSIQTGLPCEVRKIDEVRI